MKGWYGNKQKHSLASRGVKTSSIKSNGIRDFFDKNKQKNNIISKYKDFAKDMGDELYSEWMKWRDSVYHPAINQLVDVYNRNLTNILNEVEDEIFKSNDVDNWFKTNHLTEELIRKKEEIDNMFITNANALKETMGLIRSRLTNEYNKNIEEIEEEVKFELIQIGFSEKDAKEILYYSYMRDSSHEKYLLITNQEYKFRKNIEYLIDRTKHSVERRGL